MTPESLSAMHAETHGDPGPAALDIERLEGLLAKATPGPWRQQGRGVWDTRGDGEPGVPLFGGASDMGRRWGRDRGWVEVQDDAALIVEAVNALPHLLVRLKAAEAELDAYPKVGEDYAHKGYPCQWRRMTPAEVQALIDGDEAAAEIEALRAALTRAEAALRSEGFEDDADGARAALENRHG